MPFTDPLAVFQAALEAINSEDWRGAARLCDPISLRHFHRGLLAHCAPAEPVPGLTVEDLLRHQPDMPREAAEYEVAQHRKHTDPAARLRQDLPSVASVAELHDLPPLDAYAAWLEGRSFRRQIERLAASGRISVKLASLPPEAMMVRHTAIGALNDGDRVAHILYRDRFDENAEWTADAAASIAHLPADEQAFVRDQWQRGHPRVATCRRQPDGTWALIAEDSFLGIGSIGISNVGSSEPPPRSGNESG